MKIIFNRQQILAATAPLMSATSGKSSNPALEGILIEAKHPDTCTLTTYDLEKGMRTTIEAKVIEEGSYIINAQKFNQTMRVMDGEEVMLTVDSQLSAVITAGRSSHSMKALRGDAFPDLPLLESERGFTVGQGVVKEMLGKTMYAMGVNDTRPVLNGCFFEVLGDRLLLVACDSFKLAKCVKHVEIQNGNADGSDLRFRFILPVKTVNDLYKLLSDDESEELVIHMTRKHIIFHMEGLLFFSRLVEGEYIDFDRIIIQQHRIFATFDRDALLAALDRAALITEERDTRSLRSHVKLQFEEGLLKISAESATGSTYDEVEIEHEGADLLIAFRNRFLIDSVRACDCARVRMALSSPLTSVNIEPAEGGSADCEDLFMLLPVRMKD
ncbi:MAG: DNA polymerase III subunit beta [Clostridia bacterium]|nr:DNA polymerase III subunit beta [Clostridia bacterium]